MNNLAIKFSFYFIVLLITSICSAADKTEIKDVEIIDSTEYGITIEAKFYYDGKYGLNTKVVASVLSEADDDLFLTTPSISIVSKGKGSRQFFLRRPKKLGVFETDAIDIIFYKLKDKHNKNPFYGKRIPHVKKWTTKISDHRKKLKTMRKNNNVARLKDAIELIDAASIGGKRLKIAKKNLEKIISSDPKNVQAYLELARVKMKEDVQSRGHNNSNGVSQADRLINIALEINPEYANSYILGGFVKTLQGNVSSALEDFKKAKLLGSKNMWLYSNWGRALIKKGDSLAAIKIYKEAIKLPLSDYLKDPTLKSNNRAIYPIFSELISLLNDSKDWKGIDKVYKKQLSTFKFSVPCLYLDYADFRLTKYGDYKKARRYAKQARTFGCRQQEKQANSILARAYLVHIADPKPSKFTKLSEEQKTKTYYKSQALTDNEIELVLELATSKHTAHALNVLKERGTDINSKDIQNMSALAYAVYLGDEIATKELLKYGANPDLLVTKEGFTSLMVAIIYKRDSIFKILLENGADEKIESTNGLTALSISQKVGNKKIEKQLSSSKGI